MLMLVADVTEFNDYYRVNWIVERDEGVVCDSGNKYIKISQEAAEIASSQISKGNFVVAKKPVDREIMVEHLSVQELDDLERKRSLELCNAKVNMSGLAASLRGFDFFEFTLCNNYLASRGYFITNYNREEKYIEIINSGDMELIEHLETYLNLLDRIGVPHYQYTRYLKLEDDLKAAKSVEEIENTVTKFSNN